jgi:putative thioredoxin
MIDAAATKWTIDVGDESFEQEVVERSKQVPVVLDFWAPWCGPCKTLGPLLEKIAEAKAGAFVLAKVNVDEAQELASYFRVEGIPTVHAIRDGQYIPGFTGIPTEEEMKNFFDQLLPSETDNTIKEAHGLEATEPEQAENMYRIVLSQQPDNELARVGLARLLVGKHNRTEAAQLLAPLGVSGDVGVEAERLRRIIELEGDSPATGDEATLRKKLAADPENAELR